MSVTIDVDLSDRQHPDPDPRSRRRFPWSGLGVAFAAALWVVNIGLVTYVVSSNGSELGPATAEEACRDFASRHGLADQLAAGTIAPLEAHPRDLRLTAASLNQLADDLTVIDPRTGPIVGNIRAASVVVLGAAQQIERASFVEAQEKLADSVERLNRLAAQPLLQRCFSTSL